MRVKWKSNSAFNPQFVLDRIAASVKRGPDGKIAFGFEMLELKTLLFTMIDFSSEYSKHNAEALLDNAIRSWAEKGDFSKTKFFDSLNCEIRSHFGTREVVYVLSSSISMSGGFPISPIEINGAVVTCYPDGFPQGFHTRDIFNEKWNYKDPGYSSDHCAVLISVKSKHWLDAAEQCLDVLDLVRGIFCFLYDSRFQLSLSRGFRGKVSNKISLGGMHCLHYEDGSLASDKHYWFESRYEKPEPFYPSEKEIEEGRVMFQEAVSRIERHRDQRTLKAALVRYVRALDNPDRNSSVLQMWAVLESLAGRSGNAADSIVRRCSFIFDDRIYHQQVLEHLREYRNSSVHAGVSLESPDWHCYQLHKYFSGLMRFYLGHVDELDSIDKANNFLDLTSSKDKLLSEIDLRQKALRYFGFQE